MQAMPDVEITLVGGVGFFVWRWGVLSAFVSIVYLLDWRANGCCYSYC